MGQLYYLSKRTIFYSGMVFKQLKVENDTEKLDEVKATQVIVGLRHIF